MKFAVGYQTAFAYAVSLMIYQFGLLFMGATAGVVNIISLIAAVAVLALMLFLLVRPGKHQGKKKD